MGTKWHERQINASYKEMFASGRWEVDVLREALRQAWIVHYGRKPNGPDLYDLLHAPEPIKYMQRRVAKSPKKR